jgi:hypothetical protein
MVIMLMPRCYCTAGKNQSNPILAAYGGPSYREVKRPAPPSNRTKEKRMSFQNPGLLQRIGLAALPIGIALAAPAWAQDAAGGNR